MSLEIKFLLSLIIIILLIIGIKYMYEEFKSDKKDK